MESMANNGWVKITEQLPPLYEQILAVVRPKNVQKCSYIVMTWCKYVILTSGQGNLWFAKDDFDDEDDGSCVTHWMIIPEKRVIKWLPRNKLQRSNRYDCCY